MVTALWTRPSQIRSPTSRAPICQNQCYGSSRCISSRLPFFPSIMFLLEQANQSPGCVPATPLRTPRTEPTPKDAEAPTLPRPGASFTLLTARSRQGGAGGGQVCRMPLKLVAKRGGSATEEVEGRCFFFLEDRFNFWAALQGEMQKRSNEGRSTVPSGMLGGAPWFSFS